MSSMDPMKDDFWTQLGTRQRTLLRPYHFKAMVNQKSSEEKIAGLEMADLEALGHVKFDILGINLLDKIMKIKELING